ncbi:MAG: hypothetical protein Q7S11_02565 [bacterium]|nr:hypothetical protein [bacterium]
MFLLLGKRIIRDEYSSAQEKPVAHHAGPPCPFYGFIGGNGVFVENYGNACALTRAHSPCCMEMAKAKPDWDKCSTFNHPASTPILQEIMENVVANPKALWPAGKTSWEGVKIRVWFRYVMGRDYP